MAQSGIADADARLRSEFAGVLSVETVDRTLEESFSRLERSARIQAFVPVLAERAARDRLRHLATRKPANVERSA
jgi:arsenate reductase (thioredoxin)